MSGHSPLQLFSDPPFGRQLLNRNEFLVKWMHSEWHLFLSNSMLYTTSLKKTGLAPYCHLKNTCCTSFLEQQSVHDPFHELSSLFYDSNIQVLFVNYQADRWDNVHINWCGSIECLHQVPNKQVNRTQSSTDQIASHLLLHDLNFELKCRGFSLMIRCLVVKAYSNFCPLELLHSHLDITPTWKHQPLIDTASALGKDLIYSIFNLPKRWYDYNESKIDLFCENEFASATITHQIPESPTDKSTATADCQSSAVENAMDFVSRRFLKSSGCLCLKKISDIFIFLDFFLRIPSILMVLVYVLTMLKLLELLLMYLSESVRILFTESSSLSDQNNDRQGPNGFLLVDKSW